MHDLTISAAQAPTMTLIAGKGLQFFQQRLAAKTVITPE